MNTSSLGNSSSSTNNYVDNSNTQAALSESTPNVNNLADTDFSFKSKDYIGDVKSKVIDQYNARAKQLGLPAYGETTSAYQDQKANQDPNLAYYASEIELLSGCESKCTNGLSISNAFTLKRSLLNLNVSYWTNMKQYAQDNNIQDAVILQNINQNHDASQSRLQAFNANIVRSSNL